MDLIPIYWSGPTELYLLVAEFVGLVEAMVCTESGSAMIFGPAAVIIIPTALRSELDFHRVFDRTPLNK